jgi:hypothetical protein
VAQLRFLPGHGGDLLAKAKGACLPLPLLNLARRPDPARRGRAWAIRISRRGLRFG